VTQLWLAGTLIIAFAIVMLTHGFERPRCDGLTTAMFTGCRR
jgi:hypothetical protein